MWAVPTVVALLLLGPVIFAGFIVVIVVAFTFFFLRDKFKEPRPASPGQGNQGTPTS
ncbi:MAG: hypothetical protein HY685_01950 [Chloroflexi bacterium]|nr:hypothetical protein [Chloroflexota bacterium]